MLAALCLSLAQMTAPGAPPREVGRQALENIQVQYEKRYPGRHLSFDAQDDCPNRGRYVLEREGVRITSENALWSEERVFSYDDLLDGKRLEFPTETAGLLPAPPPWGGSMASSGTRSSSKTLLSALAGGAAGAGIAAAMSPNDESRGMNALVFGLSGAVGGALLSLLWSEF